MNYIKVFGIIVLTLLFISSLASASSVSMNGTVYRPLYDGSIVPDDSIISGIIWNASVPAWDIYSVSGVYRVNPSSDSILDPITFIPVSTYSAWTAQYWKTQGQGSWAQHGIITNAVNLQNDTLVRSMWTTESTWYNITYNLVEKKLKMAAYINGSGKKEMIVYSVDFDNGRTTSIDNTSKRFNINLSNTLDNILFDYSDIGSQHNISTSITQGNRFNLNVILENGSLITTGNKSGFDPSWSTNGTTTPAWNGSILTNTTTDPKNITLGISADSFYRANNTDMNANTGKTKWWEDTNNNGFQILRGNASAQAAYGTIQDLNVSLQERNYNVSFKIVGANDASTDYIQLSFYSPNNSKRPVDTGWKGYSLYFFPSYNYIYYEKNDTQDVIEDWYGATVNVGDIFTINASTTGSGLLLYRNGVLHHTFPANSNFSNGTIYFSSQGTAYGISNYSVRYSQQDNGNTTFNSTFASGRQGSTVMANWTTGTITTTNYTADWYGSTDNFSTSNVIIAANITNATVYNINASAKNQTQYARLVFHGTMNTTPSLLEVTITDEASGAAAPTYMPPVPTSCTSVNGTTFINLTCQAGSPGNGTDVMNFTKNNATVAYINTSLFYANFTGLASSTTYNFSAQAYNGSGGGTLNLTPAFIVNTTLASGAIATYPEQITVSVI